MVKKEPDICLLCGKILEIKESPDWVLICSFCWDKTVDASTLNLGVKSDE